MENEEIKQLREEIDSLKAVVNELAGALYLTRAPVLRNTNYSDEDCATQLDVTQLRAYTNENLRLKADQYDFDYIVGDGFQGWTITDYIIRIREDYNQAVAAMATKEELREIAKNGLPVSSVNKSLRLIPTEREYELVERVDLEDGLRQKQDKLTIDRYLTQDSENLVTSGAIFDALRGKQDTLTMDSYPSRNSQNPVTSDGIARALEQKQPVLTFDFIPTRNSNNPVTSGGVQSAIEYAISTIHIPEPTRIDVDRVPTRYSNNPVTSGGVYEALAEKQNQIIVEDTVRANSNNPITSGAVYAAIDALEIPEPQTYIIDSTPLNGSDNAVSSNGVYRALQEKQNRLSLDIEPTDGSLNPITSGAVYNALSVKQDSISIDSQPIQYSENPITSGAVYDAINGKQDAITFDRVPTEGSTNPVESDGIYDALATKQNTLTFDTVPTANSTNPVTSGAVKTALDTKQDTLTIDSQIIQNGLNPASSGAVYDAVEDLRGDLGNAIADAVEADSVVTEGSDKLVTSGAVYDAISEIEIPVITYDSTPTEGSLNAVTSNGIYEAIEAISGAMLYTFDQTPTSDSSNPVTSDGIYDAILTRQTNIRKSTITLTTNWNGDGTYWQAVSVDGCTPSTMINLQPTVQQIAIFSSVGATAIWVENDDGDLKFYSSNGIPSTAMTIECTLIDIGSVSPSGDLTMRTLVDSALSSTSVNPVENRAIYTALRNKQDKIVCDEVPRQNSRRLLTSGAVYRALNAMTVGLKRDAITLTTNWTGEGPYYQVVSIAGVTANSMVDLQADSTALSALNSDGVIYMWTENNNGEIRVYIIGGPTTSSITLQCTIYETITNDGSSFEYTEPTIDTEMNSSSDNTVTNRAICAALNAKQNTLQYDTAPTSGSNKMLTSGAIFTALSAKQNTMTIDALPTYGSQNPVSSDSIKLIVDGLSSRIDAIESYIQGGGNP